MASEDDCLNSEALRVDDSPKPEGSDQPGQNQKKKGHRAGRKVKEQAAKVVWYEIRPSEGKGLGAFAVRDIRPGTRLVCEESWIDTEPTESLLTIPWKFFKLTPERQSAFLSLPYKENKGRDEYFRQFFQHQEHAKVGKMVLPLEMQVKLARIYETYGVERGDGGFQFCPETKRLNHSCVPNADYCWDPDIQRKTVHAVKEIKNGEEITFTYIDSWTSREERIARLLKRHGFMCTCPACDNSTDFGKASDKRRLHMSQLFKIVKRYWSTARDTEDLVFHKDIGFGKLDKVSKDALPLAVEFNRLMEEEGIRDMGLACSCQSVATVYHGLNDPENAAVWHKRALNVAAVAMGRDHRRVKQYREYLEYAEKTARALKFSAHNATTKGST